MSQTLPAPFLTEMEQVLGAAEASQLAHAIAQTEPPTSIRLNPYKIPASLPAEVEGHVPWCETGRYLKCRPLFTADPLLHAGAYYVQEASSMFVEQAYRVISKDFIPKRMLDLCAAPGGKSTLWRSLLPDGSLLVANEPIRQRAQVLAENLTKWGHPDVVCTSAYPEEFSRLTGFFDVVAADVPCSGEGMFRKDAGAVEEWSREAVISCAERQWGILHDIWPTLRQGGYLVYSTCTYNQEENEYMVERICRELGAELVPVEVLQEWNVASDTTGRGLPVAHFFPHRVKGEGLFLALLRKTAEAVGPRGGKKRKGERGVRRQQQVQNGAKVAPWLSSNEDYRIVRPDAEHLLAVRECIADDVQQVCAAVRALTAGVLLAEEKGRKLIPQHALALSLALNPGAFPDVALDKEQALAYLRREVLSLEPDIPRGYVLATYEGHPLGFLNNLGSRANNMYPPEWRIRHL